MPARAVFSVNAKICKFGTRSRIRVFRGLNRLISLLFFRTRADAGDRPAPAIGPIARDKLSRNGWLAPSVAGNPLQNAGPTAYAPAGLGGAPPGRPRRLHPARGAGAANSAMRRIYIVCRAYAAARGLPGSARWPPCGHAIHRAVTEAPRSTPCPAITGIARTRTRRAAFRLLTCPQK